MFCQNAYYTKIEINDTGLTILLINLQAIRRTRSEAQQRMLPSSGDNRFSSHVGSVQVLQNVRTCTAAPCTAIKSLLM